VHGSQAGIVRRDPVEDLAGAVGRSVVYHDHPEVGVILAEERADRLLDPLRLVPRRDDDGEARPAFLRLALVGEPGEEDAPTVIAQDAGEEPEPDEGGEGAQAGQCPAQGGAEAGQDNPPAWGSSLGRVTQRAERKMSPIRR